MYWTRGETKKEEVENMSMRMVIQEPVRDGDAFTVKAQFIFQSLEYSADEARAFVKKIEAEASKMDSASQDGQKNILAVIRIDPIQAQINKQMGISDRLFAKYYTGTK
jgi:hypothetical protein